MEYVRNCKKNKTFKWLELLKASVGWRAHKEGRGLARIQADQQDLLPPCGPVSRINRYELWSSAQLSPENFEIKMEKRCLPRKAFSSILCSFDVLMPLLQQAFSSTAMRQWGCFTSSSANCGLGRHANSVITCPPRPMCSSLQKVSPISRCPRPATHGEFIYLIRIKQIRRNYENLRGRKQMAFTDIQG